MYFCILSSNSKLSVWLVVIWLAIRRPSVHYLNVIHVPVVRCDSIISWLSNVIRPEGCHNITTVIQYHYNNHIPGCRNLNNVTKKSAVWWRIFLLQSHTRWSVCVIIQSYLCINNIPLSPPMQCCLSKAELHVSAKLLVDSSSKYPTHNTGVITDIILSPEMNCIEGQSRVNTAPLTLDQIS